MPAHSNRWRRLGPFVGLTVAAHAAVLALPVRPAAGGASTSVPALHVRVIERTVPLPAARPVEAPLPAVHEPEAPLRPVVQPSAVREPLPPTDVVPAQIEPAPRLHDETPSMTAGWSLPGIADEDDLYFARAQLTVAPVPLAPVLIEYPGFAGADARYAGELTLFIDEQGVVVRVRADGAALPPPFEEAARRAFLGARFRPGELAEHGVVKSRIRIEVVFEGGAPLLVG